MDPRTVNASIVFSPQRSALLNVSVESIVIFPYFRLKALELGKVQKLEIQHTFGGLRFGVPMYRTFPSLCIFSGHRKDIVRRIAWGNSLTLQSIVSLHLVLIGFREPSFVIIGRRSRIPMRDVSISAADIISKDLLQALDQIIRIYDWTHYC